MTPQEDLGISARADQRSLERRITHAGSSEIEIEPLPIGNGIEIEISPSGITHNPKNPIYNGRPVGRPAYRSTVIDTISTLETDTIIGILRPMQSI